METDDTPDEAITYSRALVKALQSYEVLESKAGWFERLLIKLLRTTYRQRLRSIIELAPPEIANQIFETTDTLEQNGR